MYPSLVISLSSSIFSVLFVTVSEVFWDEVLETFVILLAILLPIKSAIFWIALFEVVLSASAATLVAHGAADCLAWSRSFWFYLLLKFLHIFYQDFC